MNNNDLAALAALGAMGVMYKKYLDGQGAGTEAAPADAAGSAGSAAGYEGVVPGSELGSQGNFRFGDAARDAGTTIRESNRALAGEQRANSINQYRYIDQPRNNRFGSGSGSGAGSTVEEVPVVYGNGYVGQQFPSNLPASTSVVPDAAPEDRGIGGAGLAAAGLGATGAGAAAYYAKVKREARLADEARAKLKAEARAGILKDQALARVTEDRDARARAQNEADRAAKAQAQADAEAKSKAIQAEIDDELKRLKSKTKGADARAAVLNKDMWAAGPTVTSETPTKKRAPIKAEVPTDMDDFNRMLRESKVGSATTTTTPASTSARASADTQTREDKKAAKARALLESSGTALPVPTNTAAPTENAARLNAQKEAALKAADAQLAAVLNSKEMADSAWKQPGETDAQAAARKAKAAEVKNAAITAHKEQVKSIKAGKYAALAALGLTGLGLGTAANAATDMTAGQRERLASDVVEGLITPLGLTPSLAGEGSDLYPSKPLSYSEKKKIIDAMSPADRKKMEASLAYQNKDKFTFQDFKNYITSKKAGGGQIKAKKMASGGMTSKVSSASKRGDGIASKGKTRCKMY